MNSNSKSKQLNEMIQISKALSNPIRIEILNHVKDRISLNQTELSINLNMNLSHVHTHVAILRRSNMITLKFIKGIGFINLNDEKLNEYCDWLNKLAC
jgi:DNA-binding transcriptional ArsR family regulator